jgi:hypothetical protein
MRGVGKSWVVGLLALVPAGAAACGPDTCRDLNCGPGVLVWWEPEDVPEATVYRLCVDGECETVELGHAGAEGQYREVQPTAVSGGDEVRVRLALLDEEENLVQAFEGGGTKAGCCIGVVLQATEDGDLVEGSP